MTRRNLGRICRPAWIGLAAPLAALFAAGCGAGIAGVAASSDSGGGGGVPPAITAFTVKDPKEPDEATLCFTLSKRATVELRYRLLSGAEHRMEQVGANPRELEAGMPSIPWNFADEPGLAASFMPGVVVFARIPGVQEEPREGENALRLGMGNDAPEIAVEDPAPEVDGVVPIQLQLSDTSGDSVSIRVEYDVEGDELGFLPARPGGLDAKDPTPDPAMGGIIAPPSPGTELVFFWDTDSDLAELERDVRLRFTPTDPVIAGVSKETGIFRVDNNAAPIVQLDSGPLILNPDERRGIPIPFRVIDEEGDLVEVIFQWRREGEEFPSLDRDGDGKIENEEVDEILADKDLRQEHHICTPYPHYAKGRVVPIDENTVRLPELASSESWILASGIVGKTIELLRPSSIPAPITPTWRSNPLVSPIAALPVGDGLTALVLDVPGNGRLREIELATGEIVREIATLGPGIPSAMAFERRQKSLLVALDDAGTWRIERVELATGAITELIVSDGTEPTPVRGIASLGTNVAVFTAGSSLFQLDYRDPLAPLLAKLLTGLASPWGVVVDPLPPDRLYLAERDANRVLAVELDSLGELPVVVKAADMQIGTLEAPEALALERFGSRMLIVTNAPGGNQLVGLDLGAKGSNKSFPIGAPSIVQVASLATGPDVLRLLCLPTSDELLVAGGIEQQRAIAAHSTFSQDVSTAPPFDPVPTPGQSWRLPDDSRLRTTSLGVAERSTWDSTDAGAGPAFVRAMAQDAEIGPAADGRAPKNVRSSLDVEPILLGGLATTDNPSSVAAADLDGDGDQDVISANFGGSSIAVFFQTAPGTFEPAPLVLGGPGTTDFPRSVATADLDGDGYLDLISGNIVNLTVFFQNGAGTFDSITLEGSSNNSSLLAADIDGDGDLDLLSADPGGRTLPVFFQTAPRTFVPAFLQIEPFSSQPGSVDVADLDGDGDLDIVCSSRTTNNLTVFFQESKGFDPIPLVLRGFPITSEPMSVSAVDMDGDGDVDLVSANFSPSFSNLTVFFQNDLGTFELTPLVLELPVGAPKSLDAGDLDGDGDLDIVVANAGAVNSLTIFFQTAPGCFEGPLFEIDVADPSSVAAVDLNGDGNLDLVSASMSNDNLAVFFQESATHLHPTPISLGDASSTNGPRSLVAGDLDADGTVDLVSPNFASAARHTLTVFFQKTLGNFDPDPLEIISFEAVSVAAADLDTDGDLDLASANFFADNLTVYFQNAPGSFDSDPLVLGGVGPVFLAAADLDGDGDQDLVAVNQSSATLGVFFQRAAGRFDAGPPITAFSRPSSVAAADLNGDGNQDLVSAIGNNLAVFFQGAPGSFDPPLPLGDSSMTNPVSVAAADLDGDGDLDLISANVGTDNLTVFFQSSPGSFDGRPLVLGGLPTTTNPRSVAAGDLDGDGDQDLASANEFGNDLTIFFQESPGSFATAPLVLGGVGVTSRPVSLVAADLDCDGDLDLASANLASDSLTVFWGGR